MFLITQFGVPTVIDCPMHSLGSKGPFLGRWHAALLAFWACVSKASSLVIRLGRNPHDSTVHTGYFLLRGMPVEKVTLQKKKVGFLFIRSKLSAFVPISTMLTFNIMTAKREQPLSKKSRCPQIQQRDRYRSSRNRSLEYCDKPSAINLQSPHRLGTGQPYLTAQMFLGDCDGPSRPRSGASLGIAVFYVCGASTLGDCWWLL